MPVPTTYSEPIFAAYLTATLDTLADTLGWDESDPRVLEAVSDALLDYGESTIGSISGSSNIRRLRALGRRAIWRAVAQSTAGNYSFSSDGQRFDRQQIHEHATLALTRAEDECRAFGDDPAYSVSVFRVDRPTDPYVVLPDEERVR